VGGGGGGGGVKEFKQFLNGGGLVVCFRLFVLFFVFVLSFFF